MIPITDLSWQSLSWQAQLSHSVRSLGELSRVLELDLEKAPVDFPINVPLPYLSRIERGNPTDPLLLQVLATAKELDTSGSASPLQEEAFLRGFGMIQKYQGRALVVTTGACAVHCRYCFRRHFPYEQHQPSHEDWQKLLANIHADTSIEEVILSGGDPLMLNDRRLRDIFGQLEKIPHVGTIRIHSRVPVVLPARVTPELLSILSASRCQVVIVTHVNHGNEVDADVMSATQKLKRSGLTLLNQSVLLRGINDSVERLVTLSKTLNSAGILPYYLHQMDDVAGAKHFEVPDSKAMALVAEMRGFLPGYLVPRLAREVPFEPAKTILS